MVEALVGMAIFGVTIGALYACITTGYSGLSFARENLRATQIMVEKLEAIRLYGWNAFTNAGYIPTTFTAAYAPETSQRTDSSKTPSTGVVYQGKVIISPVSSSVYGNYSDRMRLVTVHLTWTTGRSLRTREMSTLVTYNGLNSYVYH